METFEVEVSNQVPQRLWKIHMWEIMHKDGKIYAVAKVYEDLLEEGLMEREDFQTEYRDAKTWGEADVLLEKLPERQMIEFINSHEFVKSTTGLDARQNFYLVTAKAIAKKKGWY